MEQQEAVLLPIWWTNDLKKIEKKVNSLIESSSFSKEEKTSLQKAKGIAQENHQTDKRADGTEYIVHPFRVFISLFLELSETSVHLLAAAFLHDILEDTPYPAEQMENDFSMTVRHLVETITRNEDEKRPKTGDTINDKYYQRIINGNSLALKLKIIDKLDNIRDALNHPKVTKRRIYLRECQTIFLSLIEKLEESEKRETLHTLFKQAMLNHECYLDQFLLFNPFLDFWVIRDHVQRITLHANGIAGTTPVRNAALTLIQKIKNQQLDSIIYIANLPDFFNHWSKRKMWLRVAKQLGLLLELLSSENPPSWVQEIIDEPEYLFAVLHSRLLMPANWLFPIWQKAYAIYTLETNTAYYRSLYPDKNTETWIANLHLLLRRREALWRSMIGDGAFSANCILKKIEESTGSLSKKHAAMRLLSEYLDVKTDKNICQENTMELFSALWKKLVEKKGEPPTASPPHGRDEAPTTNTWQPVLDENIEIIGFPKVLEMCPQAKNNLFILRNLLIKHANHELTHLQATTDRCQAWIYFNNREIKKRLTFFQKNLEYINEQTTVGQLTKIGIYLQRDRIDNSLIITVEPDKWDAIKNRLPEISKDDRIKIRDHHYSATAIFDTLLKDKLAPHQINPIWMPRIYRILDTIADFQPYNVQPVTLSFQAEDTIAPIQIHLPLPTETQIREGGSRTLQAQQEERQDILARYIITSIYNYVVTLGLYSATVDCAPVDKLRETFGFTNEKLGAKLNHWASSLYLDKIYGKYLENFNFKKFTIKPSLTPRETIEFTKNDILDSGLFLGIDIGGTDIKVSLFNKGEIVAATPKDFTKFSTFAKKDGSHIQVEEFCRRIIREIDARKGSKGEVASFQWPKLAGVGISWPGAVRHSKVIAFSGTLKRLTFQKGGETTTLHYDSPAEDIHALDLTSVFRKQLKAMHRRLPETFVVTLENDGNAEAYGNYCNLVKDKNAQQVPGGKLIIKLGTSLAGGHVNAYGAISSNVGEFSKIILDFNITENAAGIQGPARNFVSSIGVRHLTRSFQFMGKPLFGELPCPCCDVKMNRTDNQHTRIEAIEVGELLNFFSLLDPTSRTEFLSQLVENDNRAVESDTYETACCTLTRILQNATSEHPLLTDYLKARGAEEASRRGISIEKKNENQENLKQLGLSRLRLLLNMPPSANTIDYNAFAEKVLGAVALFSRMGAHIAHLIVSLYNVYKKNRFTEVILGGGVLRGMSGTLVVSQAHAYLGRYYDKIFGPTKHLKKESVRLALEVTNPDTVGPFGAAMVANRLHKMNGLAVMEKEIDFRVRNLKPGEAIEVDDLKKALAQFRVSKKSIEQYMETLIAASVLIREGTEYNYVKTLNQES